MTARVVKRRTPARRLDIRTDDRKAGLAIVPSSEPYLVFSDGPSLQIFSGRRQLRALAKRILAAVGER